MEKLRLGPRPKFHLTWKELLGGGRHFGQCKGLGRPGRGGGSAKRSSGVWAAGPKRTSRRNPASSISKHF